MQQNQINLLELDKMFDDLAANNWASSEAVFSKDLCRDLAHECQKLADEGQMTKAAIGHGHSKTIQKDIRGDFTYWLSKDSASELQHFFLKQLDSIQQRLNETFYLGIQSHESHFALYPPGEGYDKHIDNHRGSGARKITFVLYLNESWNKNHGGELSIYSPENENQRLSQIEPVLARLVLFRSEIFPHQVEKSHVPRMSLTGWFRIDAL